MILLTEGEPDPDCVHCVLQAPLQAFLEAHPGKSGTDVFGGLLDLAATYLAATMPSQFRPKAMIDGPALLQRMLRESFEDFDAHRHGRH